MGYPTLEQIKNVMNANKNYTDNEIGDVTKESLGLDKVENKSSETIRGEITKANVTDALGYTPPTKNTTYSAATTSAAGLMSAADKTVVDSIATTGTSIATIANSSILTSGNCAYWRSGNVVSFRFAGNINLNNLIVGTATQVISGLPDAPTQNILMNINLMCDANTDPAKVYALFVNGGINLYRSTSDASGTYYGYIGGTYVCS